MGQSFHTDGHRVSRASLGSAFSFSAGSPGAEKRLHPTSGLEALFAGLRAIAGVSHAMGPDRSGVAQRWPLLGERGDARNTTGQPKHTDRAKTHHRLSSKHNEGTETGRETGCKAYRKSKTSALQEELPDQLHRSTGIKLSQMLQQNEEAKLG